MELHTYFICLLRKGPAWTPDVSPELELLQARHVEHVRERMDAGITIAAGPVDDGSDLRGFSIYRTATLEEARALAGDDPGVRAGRFIVELHTWMVPVGYLPAPLS